MIEKNNYIVRYFPNFITLLSLVSGFTSIRFSLNEEWKIEVFPRDGAIVSVQGRTPVELSKNMNV